MDPKGSDTESFSGYIPETSETDVWFHAIVVIYAGLSFLIIAPIVRWGRRFQRLRETKLVGGPEAYDQRNEFAPAVDNLGHAEHIISTQLSNTPPLDQRVTHVTHESTGSKAVALEQFFRRMDKIAATTYPDEDPDYMSILSGSQVRASTASRTGPSQNGVTSQPSHVPSAATTSRLHMRQVKTPKTQVWDVHVHKWKARGRIGRPEVVLKSFRKEAESMGTSSKLSQRQSLNAKPRADFGHNKVHGMSDVASSILTDDLVEPPLMQQKVIIKYQGKRQLSLRSNDLSSSQFGTTIDDISPNDAADAGDPGRVNPLHQNETQDISVCCGQGALWRPRSCIAALDILVDVSEPDYEMLRILEIGLPLTLGAVAHVLFHIITFSLIANFISSDSMIAYVIVHLMLGFTNALLGAIADAESTLCAHALSIGSWFLAGQYAQLSIIMILIANIPLVLMWLMIMDDLVLWLVGSQSIAVLAQSYTNIILGHQVLQSISRALTVLMHLNGNHAFEARFAFLEDSTMAMASWLAVLFVKSITLQEVGKIQLIFGCVSFAVKISYACLKGWLRLFCKGMLRSCALRNTEAVRSLFMTILPLLIGSFLEYGEWEMLLFFVSSLGPAEVATWAVVCAIWRLLEASTEGYGEAAAIRVAYHLGSGNGVMARHSSHKALLVATFQSLLLSSILLMAGRDISRLLTPDPILQSLVSSLISNVALGCVVMNFSLNVWSLLGAQGRYRLATFMILLTRWLLSMPLALICIYCLKFDLNSVMGAFTIGFATSVWSLAYVFFRSDWDRLSRVMRELNALMEIDSDFDDSIDEEGEASSEEDNDVNLN